MSKNQDPLNPNAVLLIKLGSALVHAEEFMSPGGHEFDKTTFDNLMQDAEVRQWITDMTKMALLPVKRT